MKYYSDDIIPDIKNALINDRQFNFKHDGHYLRYGVCPNCGKKECYISLQSPGRVACGRENNCNWSATIRELYPELFELDPAKYHDEKDSNAVAKAYMRINRGFKLDIIDGMFEQGARKLAGQWHETIKVRLWDEHYWERMITKAGVKANKGRKAMFSYGSQGKITGNAWTTPQMEYKKNDTIIITEGIFKSMAWIHIGYKSITGMSAGNLPMNVIEANKDKNILWILALDNDNAGRENSKRFIKKIAKLNERYLIAFPPNKSADWDDLYRRNQLNKTMLKSSIERGHIALAENENEKAAWIFAKKSYNYFHVSFMNKLYSYEIEMRSDEKSELIENISELEQKVDLNFFLQSIKRRKRISNTVADFLYYERDAVTGDLSYFFKVPINDGNGNWQKLSLIGSMAATPESWNKTLMEKTEGRNFRGSKKDLNILHDMWFERPASYVRSLPFVGYDKLTKAYVFYSWGAYKNNIIEPNNHDYLVVGKNNVKCKSSSREENRTDKFLAPGESFNPEWIKSYRVAFDINGMVSLAWWVGTLFSEQIREEYGYWPIMEVSGEQGTGKTQMIEFLWRCVGRPDYEGFDPSKSTNVGRARTFMQVSNLPVVLLEGDRENGRSGWDYNELKMLYNGRFGRAIGMKTQGNETIDSVFRAGIMVAQNATVQTDSEAVLARIVHVHCTKDHFTEPGEKLALGLNRMKTEELCSFIGEILKNESKIFETFKKEFEAIDNRWTHNNQHVQNRIIHNHAMVFAWVKVLPLIFGEHFDPAWIQELDEYILARAIERQSRCTEEHPQISLFWEQYEYIQSIHADKGMVKNILDHSKTSGLVAINLVQFNQICHSHQLDTIPITDLRKILTESIKYKFVAKNRNVNSSINNGKSIKCWIFKDLKKQEI